MNIGSNKGCVKNLIEVVGLSKKYGNRLALDDISFHIKPDEIVGLLGPNGAGKTSTMNILTGYISATKGVVKIDEINILEDPIKAKSKIGYLPENPPLYMDMKVKEYLNFVFDLKKVKKNKKVHVTEICELVKITDVYNRVIKNLSKGYKQRVGLAQALIGNPEILILDEPTVGLDPKQIIEIRTLVKELGKTHTVILSSHILSEIQAVCNKVIILNKGKIVADENTDNLSERISANHNILIQVSGDENAIFELLSNLDIVDKVEKVDASHEDKYPLFIIHPKEKNDIREEISKIVTGAGYLIISLKLLELSLEEAFLKLTEESQPKIDDLLPNIDSQNLQNIKKNSLNNNVQGNDSKEGDDN